MIRRARALAVFAPCLLFTAAAARAQAPEHTPTPRGELRGGTYRLRSEDSGRLETEMGALSFGLVDAPSRSFQLRNIKVQPRCKGSSAGSSTFSLRF